ncbi:hypothetical protein EDD11_004623 [Mortierella claussenii]|nr:hypothetical protein EDD11_004623 [Mortierella claussenii]
MANKDYKEDVVEQEEEVEEGEEEYYEEGEHEGDGDEGEFENNMEGHSAELDDNEENEQDYDQDAEDAGDVHVGEEIALTHEEVWDDSALIEAWDMAVKQYEVYHSKETRDSKTPSVPGTIPSSVSKSKTKAVEEATPSTPSKRAKHLHGAVSIQEPNHGDISNNAEETMAESTAPLHDPKEKLQDEGILTVHSASSEDVVTDRKPSFRKADKPSFEHHPHTNKKSSKDWQAGNGSNIKKQGHASICKGTHSSKAQTPRSKMGTLSSATNTKRKKPTISASASTPLHNATANSHVDAATIAYYQQLGYYYDPSYAAPATAEQISETGHGDQERNEDEYEQADEDEEDKDEYDEDGDTEEAVGALKDTRDWRTNRNSKKATTASATTSPAGKSANTPLQNRRPPIPSGTMPMSDTIYHVHIHILTTYLSDHNHQ